MKRHAKGLGLVIVWTVVIMFNLYSAQQIRPMGEAGNLSMMLFWGVGYIISLGLFMWIYYKLRTSYININLFS